MNFAEITSSNVRKLLAANRISIRRMAEIISISASTLTDALKSKNGLSIAMLASIANYFGVTVDMLCDESFDADHYSGFMGDYRAYSTSWQMLDQYGQEMVDLVFRQEMRRCVGQSTPLSLASRKGCPQVAFPRVEEVSSVSEQSIERKNRA